MTDNGLVCSACKKLLGERYHKVSREIRLCPSFYSGRPALNHILQILSGGNVSWKTIRRKLSSPDAA